MKIYELEDKVVSISPEWNSKINNLLYKNFVSKLIDRNQSASYYVSKRNANFDKAKQDIFVSKKAEYFALVALCKLYNFPKIKIDIDIRSGSSKGWLHDLCFKVTDQNFPNVHVKCCTSSTYRYCNDFSWTFQYSNNDRKGGKDLIFNSNEDDLVVFVYIENPEDNQGVIKAILPTNILLAQDNGEFLILRDPVKSNLKGLKKCVYYKDLIGLLKNV